MTCRHRKLEADGLVEHCNGYGLQHGDDHHASFEHESDNVGWNESNPCAWEAPDCPECEGSETVLVGGDDHDCRDCEDGCFILCPTCNGEGVDETIPPHLIGAGSLLLGPDFRAIVVWPSLAGFDVVPHEAVDEFRIVGGTRVANMDVGPGKPWQLVRAVPPVTEP